MLIVSRRRPLPKMRLLGTICSHAKIIFCLNGDGDIV
jgi:hypothetical protein